MLSLITFPLVLLILFLVVAQTISVLAYDNELSPHKDDSAGDANENLPDGSSPKIAVVVLLDDHEPHLSDCLLGIVAQDYPNFDLHLVFPSAESPVADQVGEFFQNLRLKPFLHVNSQNLDSCSQKCSSLAYVAQSLSADYQMLAILDSNFVADQRWLVELVQPLVDDGIGATTASQWFVPQGSRLGHFFQKVWNAAFLVQSHRLQVVRSGSLALRTSRIDQCDLISVWSQSFCEATSTAVALKKHKLSVQCLSGLLLENLNRRSTFGTFHWMTQQLLPLRLHHPKWNSILFHGIATGVATIVAPLVAAGCFWAGEMGAGWTVLQAVLLYQFFNFVLVANLVVSHRRVFNRRIDSDDRESVSAGKLCLYMLATVIAQICQPFAVWRVSGLQKIKWQGVEYQVKPTGRVNVVSRQLDAKGSATSRQAGDSTGAAAEATQEVQANASSNQPEAPSLKIHQQ